MGRTGKQRGDAQKSSQNPGTIRTRASSRPKSRPSAPSSSRGNRRRVDETEEAVTEAEAGRFTSRANARWCEQRKRNFLVIEKSVSGAIDSLLKLTDAFDSIGWGGVLQLPNTYYPQLVLEFYANIEGKDKAGGETVLSYVKGRRIQLTRAVLAEILGVSDEGPDFVMLKDRVKSDPQFRLEEATTRLHYFPTPRPPKNGTACYDLVNGTVNLEIRQRELVHLYSANVIPRASSLNEIRLADFYLLDKMLNGLQGVPGVPLASIILQQMSLTMRVHRPDKSLPYPLLLMKVFDHFQVDVSGEDVSITRTADVVTETILSRYRFVKEQ